MLGTQQYIGRFQHGVSITIVVDLDKLKELITYPETRGNVKQAIQYNWKGLTNATAKKVLEDYCQWARQTHSAIAQSIGETFALHTANQDGDHCICTFSPDGTIQEVPLF